MNLFRSFRHPKPDISRRVVADRSGREIADLQAHYGHEIRSTVYFYNQQLVIAASLTGSPGNICAELTEPVVANEPVDDDRLGYMALHALLSYRSEKVPSLRDHKRRDWLTFKASGAKSLKAFNAATVAVSIETVYGSLRLEAAPLVADDSVFAVRAWAPISVTHFELGRLLRKLVTGANALQDAGIF